MTFHFQSELAEKYGVDGSIVLESLWFWIAKNKANDKHFHDGRYWTYNSTKAFSEIFPFWTERQIERILKRLEESGAIFTGNYNQRQYDRTKWYALSDSIASICQNGGIHFTECVNGITQMVEPIPVTIPVNNTPIVPTGDDDTVSKKTNPMQERFSEFWKAYPKKVGKGAAEKSFKRIKPTADVFQYMLTAIENQKRSNQWQRDNGQYIPNPATWLNQKRWEDETDKAQSQRFSDPWGGVPHL